MEQVVMKDDDFLEIIIKDGIVPDSMITISKVDGNLLIRRRAVSDPKNIQHVLFSEAKADE